MKVISYRTLACSSLKLHKHLSITVWAWGATGATPFESARVNELVFSTPKSFGERECNSNVIGWLVWRKMVLGTLMMPVRERVLRVGESMIFESASLISPLKLFQLQSPGLASKSQVSRYTFIENHSREQNGSRRVARSDVLFIHSRFLCFHSDPYSVRVMVLTKDRTTGFWMRNWWIPWQDLSHLRVMLENSCLRLGRRNEEDTRAHCSVWANPCHRQLLQQYCRWCLAGYRSSWYRFKLSHGCRAQGSAWQMIYRWYRRVSLKGNVGRK